MFLQALATSMPSLEPSLSSPPTTTSLPTPTPPPGYVGKGQCVDSNSNRYDVVALELFLNVRSPHDCLEKCEVIPKGEVSDLVGFEFVPEKKPDLVTVCFCLFEDGTAPATTNELKSEFKIKSVSPWHQGKGPVEASEGDDDSVECYTLDSVKVRFDSSECPLQGSSIYN